MASNSSHIKVNCLFCALIGGADIWDRVKGVFLVILLAGIVIAAYVVGKK